MKTLFEGPRPILAIDVANLAHRAFGGPGYKGLATSEGKPSGHIFGTFKMLLSLIKKVYPGQIPQVWYALDGRPKRRMEICPEYKANRVKAFSPVPDVAEMLAFLPGKVFYHPYLEADDVLAILTKRAEGIITIVSNDKDLWQLLGNTGVRIWVGNHLLEAMEVTARFALKSARAIPLHKALFGDDSDGIKPCAPRLPRKPLIHMINGHGLTKPNDLMERVRTSFAKGDRTRSLLEEHEEVLQTQYRVTKLRTKTKKTITETQHVLDEKGLTKFFKRWECNSLIKDIPLLRAL